MVFYTGKKCSRHHRHSIIRNKHTPLMIWLSSFRPSNDFAIGNTATIEIMIQDEIVLHVISIVGLWRVFKIIRKNGAHSQFRADTSYIRNRVATITIMRAKKIVQEPRF